MKKWHNAENIVRKSDEEEINIEADVYEFIELMENKPNWAKNKYGARKVFQRKEYSIYRANDGYIIHNTNKEFRKGHTHVNSFKKAKSFVDLAIRKKLPNTPKKWELECLMRITNNNTYYNKLRDLYESL